MGAKGVRDLQNLTASISYCGFINSKEWGSGYNKKMDAFFHIQALISINHSLNGLL